MHRCTLALWAWPPPRKEGHTDAWDFQCHDDDRETFSNNEKVAFFSAFRTLTTTSYMILSSYILFFRSCSLAELCNYGRQA